MSKWSNDAFEKLNKLFFDFCLSELLWWCVAWHSFLKAACQQLYSATLGGDKCLVYCNCSSRRCSAAFIHLCTLLCLFIIVALCTPLFLKIFFSFSRFVYTNFFLFMFSYITFNFSIWSKVICYALVKTHKQHFIEFSEAGFYWRAPFVLKLWLLISLSRLQFFIHFLANNKTLQISKCGLMEHDAIFYETLMI